MSTLTAVLLDHHRDLESTCGALRDYACCDDPQELIGAYRRFEAEVTAHFSTEEDVLLAAYAEEFPALSRMLRAEHESLRRQLMQLAVDVELHSVRLEDIDALIRGLRSHAELEEITLYRWAEGRLGPQAVTNVVDRVAGRTTPTPTPHVEHTGYSR